MTDSPAKGLSHAERALAPPPKGLPRCHRDVIMLWPTLAECARDTGISYESVKAMGRRNSIGDEYRPAIIGAVIGRLKKMTAAELRQDGARWRAVTFEMLTRTALKHGATRAAS
jgi:hypothetical protein